MLLAQTINNLLKMLPQHNRQMHRASFAVICFKALPRKTEKNSAEVNNFQVKDKRIKSIHPF